MVQQSIVKACTKKSQSLIEELYEKSFIKLVDITGLLLVKSEIQGQCLKKLQW